MSFYFLGAWLCEVFFWGFSLKFSAPPGPRVVAESYRRPRGAKLRFLWERVWEEVQIFSTRSFELRSDTPHDTTTHLGTHPIHIISSFT